MDTNKYIKEKNRIMIKMIPYIILIILIALLVELYWGMKVAVITVLILGLGISFLKGRKLFSK